MKMLKFLVMTISVLITILISEIFLRTFAPQKTLSAIKQLQFSCYKKSEVIVHELIPNCNSQVVVDNRKIIMRINNIGLRGKDIQEKETQRVFFVGDSFIFGYGVEESQIVTTSLEEKLKAEVINGGIPDSGPGVEYLLTKRVGVSLKPDLIVLAIYSGNDLRDLGEETWNINEKRDLISIKNNFEFVDREGFLRRDSISRRYYIPVINESHLVAFIIDRLENLYTRLSRLLIPRLSVLHRNQGLEEDGTDLACLFYRKCDGIWKIAALRAEISIKFFHQLSQDNKIPLLVVIIPSSLQLKGIQPSHTIFNQILDNEQIPSLDLFEAFSQSKIPVDELFLKNDNHWSSRGHQVAADAIASWIQQNSK